jgi:hypothetical protein
MKRTRLVLASAALAVVLSGGAASADTFAVRNERDSGPGSLRAAITAANAEPGSDVIAFAPNVRGAISVRSALPPLRGVLEIRGPGAEGLTVQRSFARGTPAFRVFTVARGSAVTISGLTISNGRAGGRLPRGGGIDNLGRLVLSRVTVSGNVARVRGGAITNTATLRVEGSTFAANTAADHGGAIDNHGGLTVANSTFHANVATASPGFEGDGGGIYNAGSAAVTGSTISANRAAGTGGGVFQSSADGASSSSIGMTVVADNTAPAGPDAWGAFTSGGFNLIEDPAGSTGFGPTDLQNVDPALDPAGPQDNGGPTQTVALQPGSPAIDAVEEGCPPPDTDQRGVARPQDGDGDGTALCDVGAFELQAPSP